METLYPVNYGDNRERMIGIPEHHYFLRVVQVLSRQPQENRGCVR